MNTTPDRNPLVVCDPSGAAVDLVYENGKGYRKSIEQAVLWSLHIDSEKLLPYRRGGTDNCALIEIVDRGSWYQARISTPTEASGDSAAPTSGGAENSVGNQDSTSDTSAPSLSDLSIERDGGGRGLATVLESMAAVIRQRNEARPAGSYTTHLFESGEAKIRKKLGEEAVEVLLASDRHAFVAETADFLYHLLVLCEATGVALDDIANELRSR